MSGRFFFDDDNIQNSPVVETKKADTKFSALEDAGLTDKEVPTFYQAIEHAKDTKNKSGTLGLTINAAMQKLVTPYLEIEYGIYQDNYAIHLTPVHPKVNIKNDQQVKEVLMACILALNEVVPKSVKIEIHHPRPDWQKKVLSFVIVNVKKAWNVDIKELDEKTVPKIFEEAQKIILKG